MYFVDRESHSERRSTRITRSNTKYNLCSDRLNFLLSWQEMQTEQESELERRAKRPIDLPNQNVMDRRGQSVASLAVLIHPGRVGRFKFGCG